MTTIVKRSVLPVTQSSAAPELSDFAWGCPITHTPIATLRLAVAWPDSPKRCKGRNVRGIKSSAMFSLAVVLLIVLTATATLYANTYLQGLLMQRIQQVQRHNEPRAQYSDVWKWQGRR